LPFVVISQFIQHISLDKEREGLIAALNEAGYKDGETMILLYKNAQGSLPLAQQIAVDFVSRNPAVAVAISTPSALSLQNALKDQKIPLVFTAVSDPLGSKLVTTLTARPESITGISDNLSANLQLDLVQKALPSLKTIGIVYNAGEINSVKAVQDLQQEAAKRNLTLKLATVEKSSEVSLVVNNLIGEKVEALYIPNDNTVVSAMESVVLLGKKFKVPVFAGDAGSIERGALAAYAYDRFKLGKKAGELVVKILKGQNAGDLVIETKHPLITMINLKSAEDMGVPIPEDLKNTAQIIGEAP